MTTVICDRTRNTHANAGTLQRPESHTGCEQARKSWINWKFLQLSHFCSDLIFDEAPKQKRLVLLY